MINHHDLLIEILTEELPPKRLKLLEQAFLHSVRKQCADAELGFSHIQSYATPRRLALFVHKLIEQQPPQKVERKGPNIAQAFDANKQLTPAGLGFLKSCGITQEQLTTIQTEKGECLYYIGEKPGLSVDVLIPEIIRNALKELPIPKPMRWADHDFTFIRPVHSVILLYGERVIPAEFFGLQTHRMTIGHRQLSHSPIDISFPENYAAALEEQGCVMVDREERQAVILQQIDMTLHTLSEATSRGTLKIAIKEAQEYAELLDEITALVEWPKVLLCRFDESFLNIPKEALMASMQGHQKCFAIADEHDKLLPYFITVSNLQSEDESAIIRGNERVMRARLSDAKFFYESDLKAPLTSHSPRLDKTIYQEKLGTQKDKVTRVAKLAENIALNVGASGWSPFSTDMIALLKRAASLCKLDLFSHMVGEFPELQGVMGKYYALHDGESAAVAAAIEEHYWPRFAEDKIPTAPVSVALALADRLDTIIGFFSVGLIPTGDKDPFALRRAASGMLKIILENNLEINLQELSLTDHVIAFFKERFKTIAIEKGNDIDVFNAVNAISAPFLCDALSRMQAVQQFKTHSAAQALAQANKRVSNLLIKNNVDDQNFNFKLVLCESDAERILIQKIIDAENRIEPLLKTSGYTNALLVLAELKPSIDQFFEDVMIMAEDLEKRHNRLTLLKKLRELFLKVADLAELQL
jgi:glycyl-tRNA synthetase beta chain